MEVTESEILVKVPCRALKVSVGPLAVSIEVTGDNQLFVWTHSKHKGSPHGIKIPIGRFLDGLDQLIDAEFARQT